MNQQSFQTLDDAPLSSAQPNFEDERTLLSARPVVPLAKIDAKERHIRRWLLSGAFALAMMLGAASALLASYLKLRNAPSATSAVTEEVETPAVTSEAVASELPVAENTEETADAVANSEALADTEEESATRPKAPVVRHRATPNRDAELTRPRVVREENEEDDLQRIREAVLFDSWQERRARRAARRERRDRLDHHDRDLSNLDEIFSGPRRRPN